MNPTQPTTPTSFPNPNLPKGFPTDPQPGSTLAGPRPSLNAGMNPQANSTRLQPPEPMPTPKAGSEPYKSTLPPFPVEREPVRRRRGGGGMGCFRWLFNCRSVGCLLLFIIVGTIGGTAYILINRPPAVWNPIKDWFNVNLTKQEYDARTYESVSTRLNQELASFSSGTNSLHITEQDLYTVLNEKLKEMGLQDLNVELTPGLLKMYWDIETNDSPPLWMVMESRPDSAGRLVISKLGTERIGAPEFMNDTIMSLVLSGIKLLQGADQNADLIRIAFPFKENIEIKSVEINRDEIVLLLDVKTGLEDFF